jgi:type II secretion system protein N
MSRLLRIIAFAFLFVFCYVVFLYWVFPYDGLKDRIFAAIERQLGGGITVSAKTFKPYWVTGADISGLSIEGPGPQGVVELANFKRVRARASFFSLLFGGKRVSFRIEVGKGEIVGSAKLGEEQIGIDVDVDDLDVASFPFVAQTLGIKISSKLSGSASLAIDLAQPVRSSGTISLGIDDLRIAASEVKIGESPLALPDIQVAKGRESQIKISVGKGTATFDSFRFANGDLPLDLKGKIFLSNKLENYRLNMNGSFGASQKLSEALPFLFIVDAQKQEDGTYPLALTGRLAKPSIKIGTFTVPM